MGTRKLCGILPAGSLQNACLELWVKAGYRLSAKDRSYALTIDDSELDLILARPQEIPRYIAEGKADFGICGHDCIIECDAEDRVTERGELIFSKVSRAPTVWMLAVRDDSPIRKIEDLRGVSIDTEFVSMTRKWLYGQGIEAKVRFSWGATEIKPGRFCDAIVEATETGNSLRRNGLRIVAEVLRSTPRFIANISSLDDPWKREKMDDIFLLLKGTLVAEGTVGLAMNVEELNLQTLLGVLPSLRAPDVHHTSKKGWFALHTVIDEVIVRTIIPALKRAGAVDIIETPITKLIP